MQTLTQNSAPLMMAQGTKLLAVTPADNTALALGIAKGLIVSAAGNLSIIAADDTAAVTFAVQAGQTIPVFVKYVQSATTATVVAIF